MGLSMGIGQGTGVNRWPPPAITFLVSRPEELQQRRVLEIVSLNNLVRVRITQA